MSRVVAVVACGFTLAACSASMPSLEFLKPSGRTEALRIESEPTGADAIADASGNIVLQNPLPGTRGNLGQNVLEVPGTWTLDAAMRKSFRISESKRLEFRMDASNLLNHPQPAAPELDINASDPFGTIDSKTGTRQFQAMIRLEF